MTETILRLLLALLLLSFMLGIWFLLLPFRIVSMLLIQVYAAVRLYFIAKRLNKKIAKMLPKEKQKEFRQRMRVSFFRILRKGWKL